MLEPFPNKIKWTAVLGTGCDELEFAPRTVVTKLSRVSGAFCRAALVTAVSAFGVRYERGPLRRVCYPGVAA